LTGRISFRGIRGSAIGRVWMSDQAIAEKISEVAPGIFRVVLPLPIPDVGSMNSYVIVNGDRNLIVDPGMEHAACYGSMEKAIQALGVDLNRTDIFVTHHHLDHFGSVSRFLRETSRIFLSKPEAEFIMQVASGEVAAEIAEFLVLLGFPEKNPMSLISQFYASVYRQGRSWPFDCISDGDAIVRGRYRFTCLCTPGHTIGHSCLYDENRGILISGDQITAGVQFMLDRSNPLADHYLSLKRLGELDVRLVLPGHGSPFSNHRKRIDQLRTHHQGRSVAASAALGNDGKDAYEVTLALDGLLPDRGPLDAMPLVLRFIHTRHTFAYLQHLTSLGEVRREDRNGRALFYRC
jgi:glyoxylase-like metal-dependent hydrolase (beta-lactamase superfamily II)